MQSLGTNPNNRGIIDNQHFCDNPKVGRVNHCIGSKVKGRRCLFFVFIKQAVNSLIVEWVLMACIGWVTNVARYLNAYRIIMVSSTTEKTTGKPANRHPCDATCRSTR